MSEPKLISPLLDGFLIGEPISEHHGVSCYPAMRENTDERYILKVISIPASQVQLDALLLSGAYSNQEEARAYFEELAQGVTAEIKVLEKLHMLEGFMPYTAHQTVPMEEDVGYQVYLISPYKRSLERQFTIEPLTHLAAVNLGLDLCAALAASRRAGFLYLDLKPSNIFLSENKGCCIGDLGFMPMNSLKYASLPDKYRSRYTAPEVSDAFASLSDTMDIYSLGLVLYQIYNNNQLPFDGDMPTEPLAPPMYADYEMAEIILKACALDPAERWQDPVQMGQALVSYMQRNDVNAVPIVPPPVEIPEPVEEPEEAAEFLSEDENEAAMAALLEELEEETPPEEAAPVEIPPEEDLSFMDDDDETSPTEESVADLEDAPVTEEVAEMLAQVDELVAHELPEPPVAPEPIEIPFPAPIVAETEEAPEEMEELPDEPQEADESTEEEAAEESPAQETEEASEKEDLTVEGTPSDQRYSPKPKQRFNPKPLIIILIVLTLLAGMCAAGYVYYTQVYLQSVETLQITGSVDELTVSVVSEADETLLTVVCTDTYGNTRKTAVIGGKAVFSGLNPSTQYKITMEIAGFHKLTGSTTGNFVTGMETKVLGFYAVMGPEDGSVVLNFNTTGPAPETWTITYADGKTSHSQDFTGNTVTITDLRIGVKYHFTLTPKDELYLTGTTELDYIAQQLVVAQDLTIDACGGGKLHAVWTLPEGMHTDSWTVRCFNDAGYDETIVTEATEVTFENLDHSTGYTVTVMASGMNQLSTASVTANPVTIPQINTDVKTSGIALTWEYEGTAPQQGWVLSYTINGSAPQIITCAETNATLDYYPGCHYEIEVRPQDDVTYFCTPTTIDTPKAEAFDAHWIQADEIKFSMLLRPDKEDWDMWDLDDEDYRTNYQIGQKASFLMELLADRNYIQEDIVIDYVVRDQNGIPVSKASQNTRWNDMWDWIYGELDIPSLPTTAGTYIMEIYFNDMLAGTQEFTIESAAPPEAVN